jgi:hypothetical protein
MPRNSQGLCPEIVKMLEHDLWLCRKIPLLVALGVSATSTVRRVTARFAGYRVRLRSLIRRRDLPGWSEQLCAACRRSYRFTVIVCTTNVLNALAILNGFAHDPALSTIRKQQCGADSTRASDFLARLSYKSSLFSISCLTWTSQFSTMLKVANCDSTQRPLLKRIVWPIALELAGNARWISIERFLN